MSVNFAALESRLNAKVMRRVANRRVVVSAPVAAEFGGIYEAAGVEALDGLAEATEPRLTVSLADAQKLRQNTAVVLVNPVTAVSEEFLVGRGDPDGAGFIVYALRKA
ncbi:hypothetical protein [Variovorax sp. DAIF25]|uniref:hypothetical protein n=1 Tax=Variovorax sp. DAIF25 TaxID=3080983 RepID=UPI003D6B167F